MFLIARVKQVVLKHFMDLRWYSVVLAIAVYILSSWCLLRLSGETDLTSSSNFIYWIVVTASTVGYGDLSPGSTAGKYVVSLFVIPVGLGLFGLAIGRVAAYISFQWRKGIRGLKQFNYENHTLIIGWNGNRTLQLIRLLLREFESQPDKQNIILCVQADIENPLPEAISFVKVTSFSNDEEMDRAAIEKASCVIIDNPSDDITMTTALYCSSRNRSAHTIAYFNDEGLGDLLKAHCPNVECMPSISVEMIAKSAVDPGSSALHHELLDVDTGMTQYSIKYTAQQSVPVKTVFHSFKDKYNATLIALSSGGMSKLCINPPLDTMIEHGDIVYYIADERIIDIAWSKQDV